jgi:hypothetical protein
MIWIKDTFREYARLRSPDFDLSGRALAWTSLVHGAVASLAVASLIDANRRGGAREINRGEPL